MQTNNQSLIAHITLSTTLFFALFSLGVILVPALVETYVFCASQVENYYIEMLWELKKTIARAY